MTHWQTMTSVILPQAIRNALPSIGNEFIVNIKDSSVLNVISVSELFFQGKSASGTYLRYYETFFIIAVIYLALTFVFSRLLRLLERNWMALIPSGAWVSGTSTGNSYSEGGLSNVQNGKKSLR